MDPMDVYRGDVKALMQLAIGLAQEVKTLRKLLNPDPKAYKEARIDVMLDDKGGPGANPARGYSWWRYLLPDEQFLREELKATDAEIREFEKDAETRMSLT